MESSSTAPVTVLQVNDMCCREFKRKLKEDLKKLYGVSRVSVDLENKLVLVAGVVDSNLLVKTVEKTGKNAEIISIKRGSTSRKSNAREESGKCPQHTGTRAQQNGDPCDNGHRFEEDEEEHKCEAYVPLEIDGRICRDFWCKQHKQRAIFHDKVPASASTGMFGHPFHSSGAPFHFANNPWEQYGRHPGFNRGPPPPAPHGFGSGGYMPGSSGFYDHGF